MSDATTETAVVEEPVKILDQTVETETKEDSSKDDTKKPWFLKRIDDLTRDKWEARRERDALQAELAALKTTKPAPAADGQAATSSSRLAEEQLREKIRQETLIEAQLAAQVEEFNAKCNAVYKAGKTEYDDFEEVLNKGFAQIGGLKVPLVEAVLEAGDAAERILYELAKDPDEADRLQKLPPVRLGAAVAKLAAKLSKPKAERVTSAGEPVKPAIRAGVGRATNADPEKMTTKEWMAWRDKELQAGRA